MHPKAWSWKPTPWTSLLSVALGRQVPRKDFDAIWTGLTNRVPLHRGGHNRALQYWCEKWCGSHDRMLTFAAEAAAKSPALTPLPLIAAFEAALVRSPIWRTDYLERALDPALAWLDGPGVDHPNTRGDRPYAILALLQNKRYDEAVAQFRQLGTHADSDLWKFSTDLQSPAAPVKQFAALRALACRRASKSARS